MADVMVQPLEVSAQYIFDTRRTALLEALRAAQTLVEAIPRDLPLEALDSQVDAVRSLLDEAVLCGDRLCTIVHATIDIRL